MRNIKKIKNGFTIIEVLIVVSIIGILAAISVVSFSSIQSGARNDQRSSDLAIIQEALEKYYRLNGEYPSCADMTQPIDIVANQVLQGIDPSVLTTPSATSGTNSIVCSDPGNDSDVYVYSGGGDSYTLTANQEGSASRLVINSKHSPYTIAAPAAPSVSVTQSGGNIVATIASVTCSGSQAQYSISNRTNEGTFSSYSPWVSGRTSTQVSSQGVRYGYKGRARCYASDLSYSTASEGSEGTYTAPIEKRVPPVVTASTSGTTTTWSWPAVSCPAGTTANYQYEYEISPSGYDSGWVDNGTSVSIAFTTTTAEQTYTVDVQVKCQNTYVASSWSSSGSDDYYRPISTIAATGAYFTCGMFSAEQKAYCWGYNNYGQIGDYQYYIAERMLPTEIYNSGRISSKYIKTVAVGGYHACAVTSDDKVYCWGRNDVGQVGDNTTSNKSAPTAVNTSGVLSGKTIKAITAGSKHTCVIASDDQVYCWGRNDYGQIGDNTSGTNRLVPTAVDTSGVLNGKTVKAIAASGGEHTCVIASDDKSYCWGENDHGQIGDNTSGTNRLVPTAVYTGGAFSGKTIKAVTAGGGHSCAIASDNKAYCWGYNESGRLGDNTTTDRLVPTAVYTAGAFSGKTVNTISAGDYNTCAVASDNKAYCWGQNGSGQIGDNTTTAKSAPTAVYASGVLSGKTVRTVSTGLYHACAVTSENVAYCWGKNGNGQIGDSTSDTDRAIPVAVDTSGVNADLLSNSFYHSCFVFGYLTEYCWGRNDYGQIGNLASGANELYPTTIYTGGALNGKTTKSSSSGLYHSCTIASDNKAYCWGRNDYGQVGDGTTGSNKLEATAVSTSGALSGKTIKSISAGGYHVCAIASDNNAYCWGHNGYGQIGDGTSASKSSPTAVGTSGVLSGKTIKAISAGYRFTCAIASDYKAYCWGINDYGQIGDGTSGTNRLSPVAVDATGVLSGKTIKAISAGSYSACAIASDYKAYCWGYNNHGQIGDGTSGTNRLSPVAVDATGVLSGKYIRSISVGGYHTCVNANDSKAYCWGYNNYGEIGDATSGTDRLSPVAVDTTGVLSGLTIKFISAGYYHSCTIASNNNVYCWGSNTYGQIGDGTSGTNRLSPVSISL